jgi:hypothetical protein
VRVRVSEQGIEVASAAVREPGARLSLRAVRFGREGATQALGQASATASGEGVELRRGPLVEWYRAREGGIEQGFTIPAPPAPGRWERPLWIEIAASGPFRPEVAPGGAGASFRSESGVEAFRYDHLEVRDARGLLLAARLAPNPGGFRIEVTDLFAAYPITVDPLLTSPAWTAYGDVAEGSFGSSVASAGDVDGEGADDLLVGAPDRMGGLYRQGAAYLFAGSASGPAASASWSALGGQEASSFGAAVASAGDVNGDGYDDAIVGEPHFDEGHFSEGKVHLYPGSASGLAGTASWSAEGEADDAWFGASLSAAGDVNGDGYADVLIGSPRFAGGGFERGRASLYLGSPSGLAPAPAWTAVGDRDGERLGSSVLGPGDLNGDGYDDVALGAPLAYDPVRDLISEGRIAVYLGSATGPGAVPDFEAWGGRRAGFFGSALAAGDVDADGFADLIVGSFNAGAFQEGRAVLFRGGGPGPGSSPAWDAPGGNLFAYFGSSLAAGDFDGDGDADWFVGEPDFDRDFDEESVGRAYRFGWNGGAPAGPAGILEGQGAGDVFGSALGTGDFNGDGFEDLAVGAPGKDSGAGPRQGSAYVYLGSASNHPPVARAGAGQTAECTSPAGAMVLLDGTASSDPDAAPDGTGGVATFEWFESYGGPGQTQIGTGPTAAVSLPLGSHVLTLRVTDPAGATGTDEVLVEVRDTAPPRIAVAMEPELLWPPSHRMAAVHARIFASDACSQPEVVLVSIACDEPDNAPGPADGNTSFDVQDAVPGTADFDFLLRAERSEDGDGRTYTVLYRASDPSGNASTVAAQVVVPLTPRDSFATTLGREGK